MSSSAPPRSTKENPATRKTPRREKQDASHQNGEKIERDEIAILHAGGVNDSGDEQQIAGNLQRRVPACLRHPAAEDDVENREGVPERDQLHEGADRHGHGREMARGDNDADEERDGQEADPSQPGKPFAHIGCGLHFRFFTELLARAAPRAFGTRIIWCPNPAAPRKLASASAGAPLPLRGAGEAPDGCGPEPHGF